MKKLIFTFFVLLTLLADVYGTHIAGGEIYYEYLGPGAAANTDRYRITLRLFKDCNTGGADLEPTAKIRIFRTIDNSVFFENTFNRDRIETIQITPSAYPCITNLPQVCYLVGYYIHTIDLPKLPNGYKVAFTRCCRVNGIINVTPNFNVGNLFTATIPGTETINNSPNSSPQFVVKDTAVVCGGNNFTLDFGANDPDVADSLSYYFCPAWNGPNTQPFDPYPPFPNQWTSLVYAPPYSGTQPLGSGVNINATTGIISGIAPGWTGDPSGDKYVICVCVNEWRNGVIINTHRKDFILKITGCQPLNPAINVEPVTCDGFNVTFQNNASNPGSTTYLWTFGDPASGPLDTSFLQNPTHQYTDTGVYTVKLVVDLNGQCKDSSTRTIGVYPGVFPRFNNSAPACINIPVQFTDNSTNLYGNTIGWRWDFGDPATLADTSRLQNPSYTYSAPGTYPVSLRIDSDKGCSRDTIQNITITASIPVTIFPKDTTVCALDTLQLNASAAGIGTYSWVPAYNIIGANTANPLVFPFVPTKYKVTYNVNGCISTDSTTITPLNDLTNSITASNTNICAEDTITLTGNSNKTGNLSWQWGPVATLSDPTNKVTQAYPVTNTTYNLTTRWGNNCVANASIPIVVRPLAIPNAGPDAYKCEGQTTVQLSASGGNTYTWSPPAGLSNPNIANPVANPSVTTNYTVAVGVTGCSKLKTDTVVVTVRPLPPLTVTNDTLICNIDTLQLTGTGVGNFVWSPNYMISSTTAQNPFVSPDVPTLYKVRLTDGFGCFSDDSVYVDVKLVVTLDAGNDTAICRTDGFFLNTVSDGLRYKWTPSTYLNNDSIKNPFATPLSTIKYHVVANIGKCQSQDSVNITVVPYPNANAGPDTAVCIGFNAQLHASGGTSYIWTPATFLNNRFIADPVAISPTGSIQYIVTVTDTLGCPKPDKDTIFVTVIPKLNVDAGPRDTSVIVGQPLQLQATGATNYLWTPGTWLTSRTISNPICLPTSVNSIEYVLEGRDAAGCLATDTVRVTVFDLESGFYVPTAWTPNRDGLNDILRPICLGMRELTYFNVYNRFGQLVYSTSIIGQGWDGIFNGRGQDAATYVWKAEGVTFKGQVLRKKGYAVLIR